MRLPRVPRTSARDRTRHRVGRALGLALVLVPTAPSVLRRTALHEDMPTSACAFGGPEPYTGLAEEDATDELLASQVAARKAASPAPADEGCCVL